MPRTYNPRHAQPVPSRPPTRVGWGHRVALLAIVMAALTALTMPGGVI